ncbi:Hypothetical protein UVM_LOCUS177, partial [uncultured virus]
VQAQILQAMVRQDPRGLMRQCSTDATFMHLCRTEPVRVRQGKWSYVSTPWDYLLSLRPDRDPLRCLLFGWFTMLTKQYHDPRVTTATDVMNPNAVDRNDLLLWSTSPTVEDLRDSEMWSQMYWRRISGGPDSYFFNAVQRTDPRTLMLGNAQLVRDIAVEDMPLLPVGDAPPLSPNTPVHSLGIGADWRDVQPSPADLMVLHDWEGARRETRLPQFVELIDRWLPVCPITLPDGRTVPLKFSDVFKADFYVQPRWEIREDEQGDEVEDHTVPPEKYSLVTTGIRFDRSLVNPLGNPWPEEDDDYDYDDD